MMHIAAYSGGILYYKWREFHKQLTVLPDVMNIEKRQNPYIYLDSMSFTGN
jgi:hypothetical protein